MEIALGVLVTVRVFAEGDDGSVHVSNYFATTEANGSFQFRVLPPGIYRLNAFRNGYLETCYGSRRPVGAGIRIAFEAGQTTWANFGSPTSAQEPIAFVQRLSK